MHLYKLQYGTIESNNLKFITSGRCHYFVREYEFLNATSRPKITVIKKNKKYPNTRPSKCN